MSKPNLSVINDRVAVAIEGGYFAPAIIKAVKQSEVNSDRMYEVCLDDGKITCCSANQIIGPGFRNIRDVELLQCQKVYTHYRGVEVSGYVIKVNGDHVDVQLSGNDNVKVTKTVNELYLSTNRRARKTSEEPTMSELIAAMVLSELSGPPVVHKPPKAAPILVEAHNRNKSTSTNLGTSPHSLDSSGVGSWNSRHKSPTRGVKTTTTATCRTDSTKEKIVQNFSYKQAAPKKASDLPKESPMEGDDEQLILTYDQSQKSPVQKDVEMQDEPQDLRVSSQKLRPESKPQPSQPISLPQVLYPYYFPQYSTSLPPDFRIQLASVPHGGPQTPRFITLTSPRISHPQSSVPHANEGKIPHHRMHHRAVPYRKISTDDSVVGSSTGSSPASVTSKQPQQANQQPAYYPFPPHGAVPISNIAFSPIHHPGTIVSGSQPQMVIAHPSQAAQAPRHAGPANKNLKIPTAGFYDAQNQYPHAYSWTGDSTYYHGKGGKKQSFGHTRIPFNIHKTSGQIRKIKGDGKKCRKVYGMEHRDQWCTSCKWKKACQRFTD